MNSKMVADRVELARRFEALVESHAHTAAEALAKFFSQLSQAPEEVWFQHELLRQRLLARHVAHLRREMVAAARTHDDARRELDALLAWQAVAVGKLHDELVEIRRQARALHGPQAGLIVGLDGRTSFNPRPLAEQAREVVRCLSDPAARAGMSAELAERCEGWSAAVEPALAEVDRALAAVAGGKAAAQRTLKAKRKALKTFDDRFGRAGRYAKAAYELVRLDELAARLPPRTVRKSRRKTEASPAPAVERPTRELAGTLAAAVEMGRRAVQRLLGRGIGPRRRRA